MSQITGPHLRDPIAHAHVDFNLNLFPFEIRRELCFFVIGVKLWSLGRQYGYTTQIQFFRDRLDSDKIGIVLFPIQPTAARSA